MAFCGVYTTATTLSHLACFASHAVHQRDIVSEHHSGSSQIEFLYCIQRWCMINWIIVSAITVRQIVLFLLDYILCHLTGMWYMQMHIFSESDDHVVCTLSAHEAFVDFATPSID